MKRIRKRHQGFKGIGERGRNTKKPDISRYWAVCMFFYLLVSIIQYVMVKEFGLVALVITAANYRLMVLSIATILRMRGDITERGFIVLVLEGLKTANVFKKIGSDSTGAKPTCSPNSKKF